MIRIWIECWIWFECWIWLNNCIWIQFNSIHLELGDNQCLTLLQPISVWKWSDRVQGRETFSTCFILVHGTLQRQIPNISFIALNPVFAGTDCPVHSQFAVAYPWIRFKLQSDPVRFISFPPSYFLFLCLFSPIPIYLLSDK